MIKNLVISGGGISGLGILGIIKYLEEKNLLKNIKNYIGTSVGSILAFLILIGYTSEELINFSILFDFNKITTKLSLDTLISKWGFYSIDKIIYVIKELIVNKNINQNITFSEINKKFNKNIIITGTCLNENKLYYFNKEDNPDMKLLDAIKISICIPIIFTPIKYNDKLWVDGGLLNNYPIEYFDKELDCTLGITISDECFEKCNKNEINDLKNYLAYIFKCLIYGQNMIINNKYNNNSIKFIHCFDSFGSFDLTKEKKQEYYNLGYQCIKKQKNILNKFIQKN